MEKNFKIQSAKFVEKHARVTDFLEALVTVHVCNLVSASNCIQYHDFFSNVLFCNQYLLSSLCSTV